jgi:hypothetical protein
MSNPPNRKKERYATRSLEFTRRSPTEIIERSRDFLDEMRKRRTVRHFSQQPVPREALLNCIEAAACAPSGANKQP